MRRFTDFRSVWVVSGETTAPSGEIPRLGSFRARELGTRQLILLTKQRLQNTRTCPIPVDSGVLVIGYEIIPIMHGFHQQGWPAPVNLVDMHVEARALTNGVVHPDNLTLSGVLTICGISPAVTELTDLDSLSNLEALFRRIIAYEPDLTRPLYRAAYMPVAAEIERTGIPIDVPLYERFCDRLPRALHEIIAEIDRPFGIYKNDRLDANQFRDWLKQKRLPIPVDGNGQILTDFDTLKSLSRSFPQLKCVVQLEWLLHQMQLFGLAIGSDGRNRTSLRPYRSKSGRNQPSSSKSAIGMSKFMRRLIKPPQGRALAEIDVCSEEFGEAAALSGDTDMMNDYRSDDVYLAFARQCGETNLELRSRYKTALLGINYEMGEKTLARRLEIPIPLAREIIATHRRVYSTYWRWSESVVDMGTYTGCLETRQGWPLHITTDMSPAAIRNFPLQGHGSEIIRLACMLAQRIGVTVIMPIHDALLIEANTDEIQDAALACQLAIEGASEEILGGFRLKTKTENVCRYPERYEPGIGRELWNSVLNHTGWRET